MGSFDNVPTIQKYFKTSGIQEHENGQSGPLEFETEQ